MTNPHISSSFADFLAEEGIRDEVTAHATATVLAWQLRQDPTGGSPSAVTPNAPCAMPHPAPSGSTAPSHYRTRRRDRTFMRCQFPHHGGNVSSGMYATPWW